MAEQAALIIAAHGTRDAAGVSAARALGDRVAGMLPGVNVAMGFVELTDPPIDEALAGALAEQDLQQAVVVPLMIGTGSHVRNDIPEAIARGRCPGAVVNYSAHLGPDPRLIARLMHQIDTARGNWEPADTAVVLLGRGALVPDANADHCRLARIVMEKGGYPDVVPAFIQVVSPDLATGLQRAMATGAKHIVVAPHFLFPGRLLTWTHEQSDAFAMANPDVQIRVADVLGDCAELAEVVVDRYRSGVPKGAPVYLTGLALADRAVLVVGGGAVAARRLEALLEVDARVTVVAPELSDAVAGAVTAGRVSWVEREFTETDCDGAWYVLALTDVPEVNARVVAAAEQRHTFVVRGDNAIDGSAYTPATARSGGLTVGVVGDREPIRSARVRDELLSVLARS